MGEHQVGDVVFVQIGDFVYSGRVERVRADSIVVRTRDGARYVFGGAAQCYESTDPQLRLCSVDEAELYMLKVQAQTLSGQILNGVMRERHTCGDLERMRSIVSSMCAVLAVLTPQPQPQPQLAPNERVIPYT